MNFYVFFNLMEETYAVEAILDKKRVGHAVRYKVKWENYTMDECTWVFYFIWLMVGAYELFNASEGHGYDLQCFSETFIREKKAELLRFARKIGL